MDKEPTQTARNSQFPNISQFITEYSLLPVFWKYFSILFFVFLLSLLLLGIVRQGFFLTQNITEQQVLSQKRGALQKQIVYWGNLAKEYPGSRDISFRIASLQYQLGNYAQAKDAVARSLSYDPNFQPARVLESLLQN